MQIRKRLLFYYEDCLFWIKFYRHEYILALAKIGIRINLYRLGKFKDTYISKKYNSTSEKRKFKKTSDLNFLLTTSIKRSAGIRAVKLTKSNIEQYAQSVYCVEKEAYPLSHQLELEDIYDRFLEKSSDNPIGFLYFKGVTPIAYSLGSNLEYYAPYDYGLEVALHPGFLKFNTFYFENVAVISSAQNSWTSIRGVLEILCQAKKDGFKTILTHARVENKTDELFIKMGFNYLMTRKNFLETGSEFAFLEHDLRLWNK